MHAKKVILSFALVLCLILTLPVSAIWGAQLVDVEKDLIKRINQNATVKANIIKQVLGWRSVNANDWDITKLSIKKLKQVNFSLQRQGTVDWRYLGGMEVVNCSPTAQLSKTLTLSEDAQSSSTVTKQMNFSYSYEGTAGLNIEIFSAQVKQTYTAGYTQSWSDTQTKTESVSDSTNLTLNQREGCYAILRAKYYTGSALPYKAVYEPDDQSQVEFTVKAKSGLGKACVYEHVNYGGMYACTNVNTSIPNVKDLGGTWKKLNDKCSAVKLDGPVFVTLYQHKNYGGKSMQFTASSNWVGKGFNDKCSSLKVVPAEYTKALSFSSISNLIPANIKKVEMTGTINIDQKFGRDTSVINQAMSVADVNSACGGPASSTAATAGSKTGAGAMVGAGAKAAGPMAAGKPGMKASAGQAGAPKTVKLSAQALKMLKSQGKIR
jgi:hypothetical protein